MRDDKRWFSWMMAEQRVIIDICPDLGEGGLMEDGQAASSEHWFPALVPEALAAIIDAHGLRVRDVTSDWAVETVRLEGPVSLVVSYEPREELIAIEVEVPDPSAPHPDLPFRMGVDFILISLGLSGIHSWDLAYGDSVKARAILAEYAAALQRPELMRLMRGDTSVLARAIEMYRELPRTLGDARFRPDNHP